MNKIKVLHLHEMESQKCKLSCSGCYLTSSELEKGNMDRDTLFSILTKDTYLTKTLYLNNLERNINTRINESQLVMDIQNHCQNIFSESKLVTDSISATKLDGEKVRNYSYTDLLISPRNESSIEKSIPTLIESYGKVSILFTVGLDTPALLTKAIKLGVSAVELNIRKPFTSEDIVIYYQLMSYINQISRVSQKELTLRMNTCIDFVNSKKNCANPEDGEWEITTILDSNDFYSCAYTTNKCIAHTKE